MYPKLIAYIKSMKLDGNKLNGFTLNDIKEFVNAGSMTEKQKNILVNILEKRIKNEMDQIQSKPDQLYLVDVEGLSHGITEFTHKIFHGAYAISNIVIWFDQDINSDISFGKLMRELKNSMKKIANSNRKPAFIYLYRNADSSTFDFGEFQSRDCDDFFDDYIKESRTFQKLRDMNIFSSIHGYQLMSPNGVHQPKWSRRGNKSKVKQKLAYDLDVISELIDKIKEIAVGTRRFANTLYVLNHQINHINKYSSLSLEKRMALCNPTLKWFVLIPKSKNVEKTKIRTLQIKNAIITFADNEKTVRTHFDNSYKRLESQLIGKGSEISQEFASQLKENRDEIIKLIKERDEGCKTADDFNIAKKIVGVAGVVIGLASLTILSGGTALLLGGAITGIGGGGLWAGEAVWRPEKLDKIDESNLDELNEF
eukprot:273070_1